MKQPSGITHPFWGNVVDSGRYNGYTSDVRFSHPFFGNKTFPVYLGHHDITHTPAFIREHPDQYYKPVETILGEKCCLLDEFMATYSDFIANIETRLITLQRKLYDHFREHLAAHLSEFLSECPVIDTVEAHNEFIKNLSDIRLLEGGQLKLILYYDLFPAPVFPVIFVDGNLEEF